MRYEMDWIKRHYIYDSLESNKIGSILYFGIIWASFEDEVCRNVANISQSHNLSISFVNSAIPAQKAKLTKIWKYFTARYIESNTTNQIFHDFKFNANDNKPFVQYALLKQNRATYEEKAEAIIRIVFRLRNNLLHGQKNIDLLYGQNDNFKQANILLTMLIDMNIRVPL